MTSILEDSVAAASEGVSATATIIMASSTNDDNKDDSNNNHSSSSTTNDNDNKTILVTLNCLVDVEDRMWPGMNKQGGIARVTAVDRVNRCVDLHYVVDRRKERKVSLDFVALAPQYDVQQQHQAPHTMAQSSSLRDRSMLLGRCNMCGSLRTDCGSCDWMEEERRHREGDVTTTTTARATKSRSSRHRATSQQQQQQQGTSSSHATKKQRRRDLLDSSSSSSSDDDLAELIHQHRRELRRLQRKKGRQDRELEEYVHAQETEQLEALARTAAAAAQEPTSKASFSRQFRPATMDFVGDDLCDSSSDSSDDDDEDLPLAQIAFGNRKVRQNRKRRLCKLKLKYNRQSPIMPITKTNVTPTAAKHSSSARHYPTERTPTSSVLESLATTRVAKSPGALPESKSPTTPLSTTQQDESGGRLLTSSPHPSSDGVQTTSPHNNYTQSFTQDMDDDSDDDTQGQAQDGEDLGAAANSVDGDTQGFNVNDDDRGYEHDGQPTLEAPPPPPQQESLGLEGFIQPEGREVAENLPQDVMDRASDVSYKELPKFFDAEATRIEDFLLPDAKLQVAQLERDFKILERQGDNASSTAQTALITKCEQVMDDIRANLIRDGTDQCRSALRKLLDDNKYRRERRNLSVEERKDIKRQRGTLGFVRDTRLDELDRDVEKLVRKIRDAKVSLDSYSDDGVGDQDGSSNNGLSDRDDNDNTTFDSDDGMPPMASSPEPASMDIESENFDNIRPDLPPWDRHMHARRVRPPLSEAQEAPRSNRNNRPKQTKKSGKTRNQSKSSVEPKNPASSKGKPRNVTAAVGTEDGHQGSRKRNRRNANAALSTDACASTKSAGTKGNGPRKRSRPSGESLPGRSIRTESTELPDTPEQHVEPTLNQERAPKTRRRALGNHRGGDDSGAPCLDDLLAMGGSSGEHLPEEHFFNLHERNESHRSNSHRTIRDHMEAFLDANDSGSCESPSIDAELETRDRPTRREREGRKKANGGPKTSQAAGASRSTSRQRGRANRRDAALQDDSSKEEILHGDSVYSSMGSDHLFARLRDRQPTSIESATLLAALADETTDLTDLFQSLPNICPSTSPGFFSQKVRAAVSKTIAQIHVAGNIQCHSIAVRSFQAMLKLLQACGHNTLQELITGGDSARLRSHLILLIEILRLVEKGVNSHLQAEDGLLFKIFSNGHDNRFIRSIVLQLVDSLYSLFHPTAWGNSNLTTGSSSQLVLLNSLVSLRNALGRVAPLAEFTCDSIANQMECQSWRVSDTPQKRAFVSSVDPAAWRLLLQDGNDAQETKESRLSHFKNELPRCEVQALWSILAFVAARDSRSAVSNSDAGVCWQLASKFLLRGTLICKRPESSMGSGQSLPPSASQLDCCQNEIRFLVSILQADAAANLKKDDAVVDIVKRAVALQADDYALNDHSRTAVYPSLGGDKNEMRRVRRIWGGFAVNSVSISSNVAQQMDKLEVTDEVVGTLFGQPALLPSSILARQCLSLLFAWAQKIPAKRVRFNRLLTAIRSLARHFTDEAMQMEKKNSREESSSTSAPDLFALAFSIGATPNDSGPDRKSLYLREVAAYLLAVSAVSVKYRVSAIEGTTKAPSLAGLPAQLWDTLADDVMKSHQKNTSHTQVALYQGGDYKLYATAKSITFAALSVMGIPAWQGDNWEDFQGPINLAHIGAPKEDSLLYPMNCLIACLNCLCDLRSCNKTIMASLCTYIATIYCHACRLLPSIAANPEHQILLPAIEALGKTSIDTIAHAFKRCFQAITHDSTCGPESDVSFRALLAALRGASFLAEHIGNRLPVSASEDTNATLSVAAQASQPTSDEDQWGGIDDDAFASLDLDVFECDTAEQESINSRDENSILFSFLAEALRSSEPSKRYIIDDRIEQQQSTQEGSISVQGKVLVARHCRYVCDCLAVLGAKKGSHVAQSLRSFLDRSDATESADAEDIVYQEELVQLTSVALCTASAIVPASSDAVRTNREPVLLSLITDLVDSSILAKFPTCNFLSIRKTSGRDSEEKECARLWALQDRGRVQAGVRQLGDEAWQFCQSLGVALTNDGDTMGRKLAEVLLLEAKSSPPEDDPDKLELLSVEWECFKRIRILTSIVRVVSGHRVQEFERICSHMIAKSSEQLVAAWKRLNLSIDTGESENGGALYRQAKLTELVSCYGELHVTLLASILRESRKDHSPSFKSLLQCIRNQYFSSTLLGDQKMVAQGLHEITTAAYAVQKRGRQANSNISAPSDAITSCTVRLLQGSLIRRSREILLHISELPEADNDERLLNAVVAVGIGKIAGLDEETIGASGLILAFSLSQSARKPHKLHDNLLQYYSSPLQHGVGEYMESKLAASATELQALWNLKHTILGKYLVPRLRMNQGNSDMQLKKRIVRFVKYIIDAENNVSFILDGEDQDRETNLLSLKELARGLTLSLRVPLESRCVDAELVSTIFQCAKSLAASLVSSGSNLLLGVSKTLTTAKWGQSESSAFDGRDHNASSQELVASFLWFSLLWFKGVAEIIVDQSEGASDRLLELCKDVQADKKRWPHVSQEIETTLIFLTNHLFPRASRVVNVYAKKSQAAIGTTEDEDPSPLVWSSDTYVLKAAKNLLVEMIPLC